MVNRRNNFMSKNSVILEFFYKISELSELLYLVLLVLRKACQALRLTMTRTCFVLLPSHLAPARTAAAAADAMPLRSALVLSSYYSGSGGANHLHLLRRKRKGRFHIHNHMKLMIWTISGHIVGFYF